MKLAKKVGTSCVSKHLYDKQLEEVGKGSMVGFKFVGCETKYKNLRAIENFSLFLWVQVQAFGGCVLDPSSA